MKTLLIILLLSTAARIGYGQVQSGNQPLEILLIGTAHQYKSANHEQFTYALDKANAFRPDAVFGEYLSAADYDAVADYWNKAAIEKRIAYVKKRPYTDPKNSVAFIRKQYQLLREHPNYHQDRMKLARALYLSHDYGNAQYQLYQLDQAKNAFGAEERAAYRAILGEPDSLYRTQASEYHNLFFPLIDNFKQDRILPMDCQQYDLAYTAANQKATTAFMAFEEKLDTTSADYAQLTAMYQRLQELQKKSREATKAGRSLPYTNSPDYDEMAHMDDALGGERIYDLKGYPKAEVLEKEKYWQLRNDCMSRNVVTRARAANAKRVVVGVGASHRAPLLKLLRAMPNVTVYTLNEYQP